MGPDQKKIALKTALIWILLITLPVSGTVTLGYLYYVYQLEQKLSDPSYFVTNVEHQTGARGRLPQGFIPEKLHLATDKPRNLYQYPLARMQESMKACPVLEQCRIFKRAPATLVVQYKMRKPVAELWDYRNTLVDKDGVLFPYHPFYPETKRIKVFLGLGEKEGGWNTKLTTKRWQLAREVLRVVKTHPDVAIDWVDVSKGDAPSYGTREVVLAADAAEGRHLIRCHLRTLSKALSQYRAINGRLQLKSALIDLRVPSLALIEPLAP